jgi:hypothetical protein
MKAFLRLAWALGMSLLVVCSLVGVATLWSACTSPIPGGPLANLGPEARERRTLQGRPVERLRAGSYTYVRVVDDQGVGRWVVTLGRVPAEALRVEARTMARTTNFESKRLQRRFDELFFGTVRAVAP